MIIKSNQTHRARNAVYLRFSDLEYNQITKDSLKRGLKVQDILKRTYFNLDDGMPLMPVEKCNEFILEIKRIGVNINQISKKINSGFRTGWSFRFEKAMYDLKILKQAVMNHVAS